MHGHTVAVSHFGSSVEKDKIVVPERSEGGLSIKDIESSNKHQFSYYNDENIHSSSSKNNVNKSPFRKTKLNKTQSDTIESGNNVYSSFTFSLSSFKDISDTKSHINGYKLSIAALKSLDTLISTEEENFIRSQSCDFKKGWLYNEVVNSYFYQLLQERKDIQFVDSNVSFCVYEGISNDLPLPYQISSLNYLFIPLCINSHWILLVIDLKKQIFLVYDPSIDYTDEYTDGFRNWANLLNKILEKNISWQIKHPLHLLQLDDEDCGVFVCFYAHQIVNNGNLTEEFSPLQFRKHIYYCLFYGFKTSSFHKSKPASFLDIRFKNFILQKPISKYLKENDIKLYPFIIKSLDPYISDEEEELMRSYSKTFKRGWLNNIVIDIFLWKILNDNGNYMVTRSCFSTDISKLIYEKNLESIMSKEYLLIPINHNSHWILIVANLKEHYFELYDSQNEVFNPSYNNLLQECCDFLQNTLDSFDKWKIKCPPPHVLQNDYMSCGVYMCFYAYQIINGRSLSNYFDPVCFRAFIYGCIMENY